MSILRAWGARASRAAFGGAFGGMIASFVDAAYATEGKALAEAWIADLGLVAPLAIPVGLGVSAGLVLARPDRSFTIALVRHELCAEDEAGGQRRAFLGLSLAAAGLFLAIAADLGRTFLAATPDPRQAGKWWPSRS